MCKNREKCFFLFVCVKKRYMREQCIHPEIWEKFFIIFFARSTNLVNLNNQNKA